MSAYQAYNIDTKIDDGIPIRGVVIAAYSQAPLGVKYASSAVADSATTCYNTTNNAYSIGNGDARNCALAFRFK